MTPAASFFETDNIVRFEWNHNEDKYYTRTVGVELKSAGSKSPPPPMDASTLQILSPVDYLEPFNKRMEAQLAVFECKITDTLLHKPNFKDLVKDTLTFRISIKSQDGKRTFNGVFDAIIEPPPARIHWSAVNNDGEKADYASRKPIRLNPDGKSSFHLTCWVEEWDTQRAEYKIREDDFYGFTHWVGKDDPITTDIVCPRPKPWAKEVRGSTQKETDWYSEEPLPSTKFPNIPTLPVETTIRVRAWRKDAIQARLPNDIQCSEKHRAEVYVPVLLDGKYEIHVKYDPDAGGRVYRKTTFKEKQEFETDAVDKLTFEVYARRKDRTPEEVNEYGDLKLSLSDDTYVLDEVSREKGKVKATVRAKYQFGGSEGSAEPKLTLKVEGKIKNPNGIEVDLDPLEEPLHPRPPRLRIESTIEPAEVRSGGGIALQADGEMGFSVDLLLRKQDYYSGEWKDEDFADYSVALRIMPGGSGGDFDAYGKATEIARQLVGPSQEPEVNGAHIKTHWKSLITLPDPKYPEFTDTEIILKLWARAWRTL